MSSINQNSKARTERCIGTWLLMSILLIIGGCSSLYYDAMEKLGIEKREILVDRVGDARDAQNEAQETFRSALERFQSVVSSPDTELKERYEKINDAYSDSESIAEEVRDRIDAVEEVSDALFDEWEDELDRYESTSLRQSSERKLNETRKQYSLLIDRMHKAEERMDPVLQAFEDQVLFLKHNLNAQAIGSLEGELGRIRQDVDALIRNMEQSIAESEAFIKRFRTE